MKLVLTFNVVGAGSVSLAKARSLPQWFQTAAENGRQTRYRRLEREKLGGRDGSDRAWETQSVRNRCRSETVRAVAVLLLYML